MKLTTRGRYAITAMLDMALRQTDKPVSLLEIGRRNRISRLYLEKLFAQLKEQGLVRGVRGPSGGYVLAARGDDISVGDVLDAVDRLDATSCGGQKSCLGGGPCLTHNLWERLNDNVLSFLHGISLQQLAEEIQRDIVLGRRPAMAVAEDRVAIREYLQ